LIGSTEKALGSAICTHGFRLIDDLLAHFAGLHTGSRNE